MAVKEDGCLEAWRRKTRTARFLFLKQFITALLVCVCLLAASACSKLNIVKRQVGVPSLLTPLADADTQTLINEVNREAQVRSINAKFDIEFLDTTFAKCGIAEKYRTAEAKVISQRPGQIYATIQVPFVGSKVAEMTSDGNHFRIAILQGDEKYRRFVKGTNSAVYPKINEDGADDCGGKNKGMMTERRTVSALSSLRPQHLTDALLVRPVAQSGTNFLYARSEEFEEESDMRPNAKNGARVVRGYYVLDELVPEAANRARIVRRFWFDRVGSLNLARVQNYDERGAVITDVVYRNQRTIGQNAQYVLPMVIELTRPQDRYSLRLTYQTPEAAQLDKSYEPQTFNLENLSGLMEVDLDKK